MRISTIIPVYNSAPYLRKCLAALEPSVGDDFEIIVADDASTDDIESVVADFPVRHLRLTENGGPAPSRNHGARHASGELLFFVDADVIVKPDTVERIRETFASNPELSAVFGSYDDAPTEPDTISQYRNLLHHYVHQNGNSEAFTFWCGCGAMRKAVFHQVGGFDEGRFARGFQDVELGYRVCDEGHHIRLDRDLQCTHQKKWSLRDMIRTDVVKRAIPWAHLILSRESAPNDLNIRTDQRVSTALVGLAGLFALTGLLALGTAVAGGLFAAMATCLLGVAFLNRDLYGFYVRKRGLRFALASFPLHLIYFACGGAGFAYGWLSHQLANRRRRTPQPDPEHTS